jgi:hypothetical protein
MTELELVDAEFSEKESSMTSSPDNTVESLDDILADFVVWCMCGKDECIKSQNYKLSKQSLDSHYLSIFLELLKDEADEVDKWTPEMDSYIRQARQVVYGRNALRQELRTALQDRLGEKDG